MIGVGLLALIVVLLFAFPFFKQGQLLTTIPESILSLLTVFFSILLEALPFLLIGAFFSALIGIWVKPEFITKWLPRHPILSLLPALLFAFILPICECAIVPVIRHFIRKGVPLHVAVTFMTAAPILNPVVAASTYYAFNMNVSFVIWRMGLAMICTFIISLITYRAFKKQQESVLKNEVNMPVHSNHHHKGVLTILNHTADDFLFMSKFFIIGAFLASIFQTFIARDWLLAVNESSALGILFMMILAYLLSLCSEADAFIAASFGTSFSFPATLAFLILGPMLDLKNTLMMLSVFKFRFTVFFHVTVFTVVFVTLIICSLIGIGG